uniref:Uncharacterized protein n=1 Tax=Rhizophora mucronata TaxID=61149 RepID=A0A2P2QZP8_RHIMU
MQRNKSLQCFTLH